MGFSSVQFSSVAQSCPTLCDPMNRTTLGLPVHHQLLESTQTHVHWVGDAYQPFNSLSSLSPPALNLLQHQGLFKWVSSSHQVAKALISTFIYFFSRFPSTWVNIYSFKLVTSTLNFIPSFIWHNIMASRNFSKALGLS